MSDKFLTARMECSVCLQEDEFSTEDWSDDNYPDPKADLEETMNEAWRWAEKHLKGCLTGEG